MVVETKPALGIKDVAALPQVSIAPVSRVLAGTPVRPAYRDRVMAVLATVGCRPNLATRRLRATHAGVSSENPWIGVIVINIAAGGKRSGADPPPIAPAATAEARRECRG